MSGAFDRALAFVLRWEGRDSLPRPGDPNPTRAGITQATYNAVARAHGAPARSVFDLSPSDIRQFYGWLWDEARAARLPDLLAIAYFDAVVNLGAEQATKQLQRAVGAAPDGVLGPKTLAIAAAAVPKEAVIRMLGQRLRFYRRLAVSSPDKARWLKGWEHRTTDLQKMLGV